MPNADNGGRTYMRFDSRDYLYWSDTLIAVVVPSIADTANNNNTGFGGAGTGTLKVKVNSGDTTSSSNPLTVFYAASNSIDSMALGRKKYVNNLFDYLGTGGYRFSIDTSISNHDSLKSCVVKAIHDWVCLTTINFEVGSDTISTTNKATKDNINMIQVGRADDSTVIARTSQWITGKCNVIDKVSVSEIDLLVNPIFLNDLFGDTANVPLPPTKIDFYAVMIHELGHAHSLDHVIDKNAVMHWDVTRGPQTVAQRRMRLYNDASCADGGSFIVDETQNPYFSTLCGWSEMLLNNTGNCSLFNSIRKPFAVNDIKFYPNPITESLVIEYAIDKPATIEVQVYNILGEIVYSSHGQSQAGMNKEVLSSEQWTNGFYIVNVKINNQNNIAKIIKN
jgi:hypothetical protein